MDQPGKAQTELTEIAKPQLTVAGDLPIVLDARGAKPVEVTTPKPTEPVFSAHSVYRKVGDLALNVSTGTNAKLFVQPSEPATTGTFEYLARTDLEAPPITMAIAGPGLILHPRYLTPEAGKRLDGRRKLPAVYVGAGRADDYVGRDVRGKIAVVRSTAELAIEAQAAAAAAAKAALIVVLAAGPGVFKPYVPPTAALPTVGLDQTEGAELLRRMGQGAVSLDLVGTQWSPYHYGVMLPSAQVPDGIRHTPDATNTARQHTRVYAVRPNQTGGFGDHAIRPYTFASVATIHLRPFPFERDDYYTANDSGYSPTVFADFPTDSMVDLYKTFQPGTESTQSYYRGPMRSGSSAIRSVPSRTGDTMLYTYDSFVDSEPDHVTGNQGVKTAARFYRDGALVGENRYAVGYFDVAVPQPATYRVELDVSEGRPGWTVSTEVYSAWTFRSARPAGSATVPLPGLVATWDLDLDLNNAAAAGKYFALRLTAGTQPGAQPVPVRTVAVWTSFDDGGTWKKASIGGVDGQYLGTVRHPKLRDTTGYVSLRYEITDVDGNKLEQTVMRAYALK